MDMQRFKAYRDKVVGNCAQVIVGKEETVAVMTENARKNRRYTGLKLRLQGKA